MLKLVKILKKRWYLVVIVLIIVGIALWQQQQAVSKLAAEKTFVLKRQTVQETLSFSGDVDATEKATLQFQTSGKLAWVKVKEGDRVEKWQAIAGLDTTDAYKNLQKVLRDYSKERNDFDQDYYVTYREQKPQTALTDTLKRILEKNQWDLEKAVLDVELKDYSLKLATLVSPIAGIVTRVDAPVAGVNIVGATTLFQVVNPDSVYFSATADQTEVVKLKEGLTGELVFDAYPEDKVTGTITSIAFTPKTDETGTVYQIKMSYPAANSDYKYRLGMTGDVTFVTKERPNILAIPTNAIKTEEGKKYVMKKVDGKPIKTLIEVGSAVDSQTEVISGLSEGDEIYTAPDVAKN